MIVNLEGSLAPLQNSFYPDKKATRIFLRKSIFVLYTVLNADQIIVAGEWFVTFVFFHQKRSLHFPDGGLSSEFMIGFPSEFLSSQHFRNLYLLTLVANLCSRLFAMRMWFLEFCSGSY